MDSTANHVELSVATERLQAAGVSDTGRVRTRNEDSIYLQEEGRLVLLADGMGGHEFGAEASRTAIEILARDLGPEVLAEMLMDITCSGGDIPPEISCLLIMVDAAVREANNTLYARNQEGRVQRYMGTTVVGLLPVELEHVLWFHVGDSRIYRLRDNVLEQMTADHSAYQEWLKGGRQGEQPGRNVITRAIGPFPSISAEVKWERRRDGDLYLLCSDGLTDMLSEDRIAGVLNDGNDLSSMALQLVEAANSAGGKDNVSAVLCRF